MTDSYSDKTLADLKVEAKERGYSGLSGLSKDDLVQLLEQDDAESEAEEVEETEVDETPEDNNETVNPTLPHAFGTCVPLGECVCRDTKDVESESTTEESVSV